MGFEGEISSFSNIIHFNTNNPECSIDVEVLVNNVSDITTNDGTASITVIGAMGSYSVLWSSGSTLTEI